MSDLTMWWEGGQRRRWQHFVDDVPAEDDKIPVILNKAFALLAHLMLT